VFLKAQQTAGIRKHQQRAQIMQEGGDQCPFSSLETGPRGARMIERRAL
jgi:hypothetical protein